MNHSERTWQVRENCIMRVFITWSKNLKRPFEEDLGVGGRTILA
jgi:hypothetical protein